MLRGAAGLGAAGLAAGMLAGAAAAPASAATPGSSSTGGDGPPAAAHDEPLVIHVHDARTGVVDLYTGTQHVRVTDHQLAARLARAAR